MGKLKLVKKLFVIYTDSEYIVDIPTAWTLQFLDILIHAVDGLLSCSPSSMIADGSLKQNLSDLLLTELGLCLRYKARD
jgi:hypothetical protein